ncbi:MAG TPA: PilT/PilU family type 4a pilus ATPase [Phycisphaerae bacterium]|nr:PilT/PilU family type 4a pilus ATPase [Phycisphaerae bacterium]
MNEALRQLLLDSVAIGASDLLLVSGAPATALVAGQWRALADKPLSSAEIEQMVGAMLTPAQRQQLDVDRDIDLAMAVPEAGRFRVNVHFQRGQIAVAIRTIPPAPPTFGSLKLPPQILDFTRFPSGLVLLTGPTGSGKSTTLAALIEEMNRRRCGHVVTIEDPVEFSFQHGTCLIEQRQIGSDSPSFASALRHILRQRPDVILIGEMRDRETISAALTAAETGHLVLASLHTAGADLSLSRIIDVFPPAQQPHVRTQVAASLRAIVSQTLLPDQRDGGLIPATEILVANSAIRRAIRDNETHLILGMIETGKRSGMHTLEQNLAELVRSGHVRAEDALAAAGDSAQLRRLIGDKLQRGETAGAATWVDTGDEALRALPL